MEDTTESLETLIPRSNSYSEDSEYLCEKLGASRRSKRWSRRALPYSLIGVLILSLLVNIGLVFVSHGAISEVQILLRDRERNSSPQPRLYSPAQDAVELKLTKFDSAVLDGKTSYQGPPTPERDELWRGLYRHMDSHISAEEAKLLPNKTAPEYEYEGSGYLIVLNLFHDLHCLDSIRQYAWYFMEEQWNSTHNPYTLYESPTEAVIAKGGKGTSLEHVDHCIDILRQSTQCNADITPNVFQYSSKVDKIMARGTVVHECRNFDKIIDWAKRNEAVKNPDDLFGDGPELGKCAFEDPWMCLYE